MKMAVSNIGWEAGSDELVYDWMKKYGFSGLEIAPTRIFANNPYGQLEKARVWSEELKDKFGFIIPSMQSIWYGRQEKIWGFEKERQTLMDYTKKAIDFASIIGCKNLVFGCPRNRCMPEDADLNVAVSFFRVLGDYAWEQGTVIGMEANPIIYDTNFIIDTISALDLIDQVNSHGFLLNLDVGTMIYNEENISRLKGKVKFINHVHISEPGLRPIKDREIHKELMNLLSEEDYKGYISIEIGKLDKLDMLRENIVYVSKIFGEN